MSDRIDGELAKDLTSHPVADIEKILTAADYRTKTAAHPAGGAFHRVRMEP